MLELSVNKDHDGLGYNSQNLKKQTPIAIEGQVLPLLDFFSSARYLLNGYIYALEEDGIDEEEGVVYKKDEGRGLTN